MSTRTLTAMDAHNLESTLALTSITEEVELIAHALQWPEETLCGGQPNVTMTEGGVSFMKGLLPILRGYYQRVVEIATNLSGDHPDYKVAGEIYDRMARVLLMVGALATRADTGVEDNVGLHRIREEIQAAQEVAESHYAARQEAAEPRTHHTNVGGTA